MAEGEEDSTAAADMIQILRNIVQDHVHVPIPSSPYIAVRFAAVAARRRYRTP